jgi:hypothetical protein
MAVAVDCGTAGSAQLQTAADGQRLLPASRNTDLPWLGINRVQITLNQAATLTSADVTVVGAKGTNYGPVTISGSGTLFTLTLARPIKKADRITITINGAGIIAYSRRLDILPGDFNDDGAVNNKDVTAVHNEFLRKNGALPTIFGDVVGDGTVDSKDYKAEKKLVGTKLPKLGGKVPKAVLARALARQHVDAKDLFARPRT